MYLDISTLRRKDRTYRRVLLRESYRHQGRVKKRTIANLSACSEAEIEAMQLALRHKKNLNALSADSITVAQGPAIGAVWLVYTLARRLGIVQALGCSREGKLALWQVIARIIDQGSRLSAVRLADTHGACDVLDLDAFHEEHLYANLDWLQAQQVRIEDTLFTLTREGEQPELFLYDVTSSYLEGEQNELAAFGYNRDGKKGKRQIVLGLLCDHHGQSLSIEVFEGNTADSQTFAHQVSKVAERFGGGRVTFVGDRGMIRGPQMALLSTYEQEGFHYITAITKAQIETLLKADTIQMSLFDQTLGEVQTVAGARYVLRRNPVRVQEIQRSREDKYRTLDTLVQERNAYLQNHPRATVKAAQRKIERKARQLRIAAWVKLTAQGRVLSVSKDAESLQAISQLDGCYVLKTDLTAEMASKELVHERYKDLAQVEWAFRTSKTTHLEMRPLYLRLAARTRGHALVVMLAYRIVKALSTYWAALEITVEEGLRELDTLCMTTVSIAGNGQVHRIPEPRPLCQQLLQAAEVTLPEALPSKGVRVATKKKLTERRKAA